MSADNYIFVSKVAEDEYHVTLRFASVFYKDETDEAPMEAYGLDGTQNGWMLRGDSANEGRWFETIDEAHAAATRHPEWLENPPEPIVVCPTLEDALFAAHKEASIMSVLEYGVSVQDGLIA